MKEPGADEFEAMVANFQATSQRIKYSLVPVVAAVRGLALGGGCEFQMHSARTIAHLESYIGLVEAGVGLLPAGGGLVWLWWAYGALQAARLATLWWREPCLHSPEGQLHRLLSGVV